jgi:hypothetical protein
MRRQHTDPLQLDLFAAVFQAAAPAAPVVLAVGAPPADPVETYRAGYEFGRCHGWTVDSNPAHRALELAIGQENPEWCDRHREGVRAFRDGYYEALADFHPHTCPGRVARK